jgi:polysaccharide export outer membrane protein
MDSDEVVLRGGTLRRFVIGCLAVVLSACGSSAAYVWIQDLPNNSPDASRADEYTINAGDTVNIRVFEQEAISSRVRVRADGRVALPFLGDTEVRGKRPQDLARELEARLKEYIVSPKVTVNVDEFQPITVAVLGEVAHPGSYPLDPVNAGVLQALAGAGGLTEFANRDRIFVLRRVPSVQRIRFTFDTLNGSEPRAVTFALQSGDVVVVE